MIDMDMNKQGHVFPTFQVTPTRAMAADFLRGQGADPEPETVPPTYLIFLRGETRGANLFEALDIPREKALHGGQTYEWHAPVDWDEPLDVTATVDSITEKSGKNGTVWFANVSLEYRKADGALAVKEITKLVKRG